MPVYQNKLLPQLYGYDTESDGTHRRKTVFSLVQKACVYNGWTLVFASLSFPSTEWNFTSVKLVKILLLSSVKKNYYVPLATKY